MLGPNRPELYSQAFAMRQCAVGAPLHNGTRVWGGVVTWSSYDLSGISLNPQAGRYSGFYNRTLDMCVEIYYIYINLLK